MSNVEKLPSRNNWFCAPIKVGGVTKALTCPNCGDFRIYARLVMSGNHDPINMETRPWDRAILIAFHCRKCDAEPELAIYERSGLTCVEWFNR